MDGLTVNKERTALVVIDLQKGIVKMPAEPHAAADVIANAAKLAKAFRAHGMPVFLVHVTPSADGRDALHPAHDAAPVNLPRTEDWAEIVPEMGPESGDFIITKRQWGAFYGTELDLQMRRRGIDTIVLCGISTNIGVESTARVAFEYGYAQIFAEDATAARTAGEHEHAMKGIFTRMGRVRTTDEIVAAIG